MLILGIAKMGPPSDPQSVVNHELKVRIDRWEFKMNSFGRQTIAGSDKANWSLPILMDIEIIFLITSLAGVRDTKIESY